MLITLGWHEIVIRLALTLVAGILIGVNRSEHGHAARLLTTLLVCLAASVSMIQVNLLLSIGWQELRLFCRTGPDAASVRHLIRDRIHRGRCHRTQRQLVHGEQSGVLHLEWKS